MIAVQKRTVDQRLDERAPQHRVFPGEILERAAVVLDASDVRARALLDVRALGPELGAHSEAPLAGQLRVERRAHVE